MLLALGCAATEPESRTNVVVVVIDTLRADHVGTLGYEHKTTPRLDQLARDSWVYTRAYATSPWTLPTHASLFTGRLPSEHGARRSATDGIGDDEFNALQARTDLPTLAGELAGRGWRTGGFLANQVLALPWNLERGFGTWQVRNAAARFLVGSALDWIDEDSEAPFFLFLNFMDSHHPVNLSRQELELEVALPPGQRRRFPDYADAVLEGREIPDGLLEEVIAQYDTGIANADRGLGELLDGLAERNLLDSTLLVVTSDHGEFLGEHGLVEHGVDVYEEVLRVPLVIHHPGQQEGRRDATPISLADLPRLVLDTVDPSNPSAAFPHAVRERPVVGEAYFAFAVHLKHRPHLARVRTAYYGEDYKLVHSSDGAHELYDIERDPDELRNLAAALPERLAEALEAFERHRESLEPAGVTVAPSLSEEERERLRALGYL